MAIFVSKADHALHELLWRAHSGELKAVRDLRRLGRHVERSVLARAVAWHLDDRIIVHRNKTIVFT